MCSSIDILVLYKFWSAKLDPKSFLMLSKVKFKVTSSDLKYKKRHVFNFNHSVVPGMSLNKDFAVFGSIEVFKNSSQYKNVNIANLI